MYFRRQLFLNLLLTVLITVLVAGCGCDKKNTDNSADKKVSISNLADSKKTTDDQTEKTPKITTADKTITEKTTDNNAPKEMTPEEINRALREKEDKAAAKVAEQVSEMKKEINADFLPDGFVFVVDKEQVKRRDEQEKINKFKDYADRTMLAQFIKHLHFNVEPIDSLKGIELVMDELKNESLIANIINKKFASTYNEIKVAYDERFAEIPESTRRPLDVELAESIKQELSFEKFLTWIEKERKKFDDYLSFSLENFFKNKDYLKGGANVNNSILSFIDLALNGRKADVPVVPSLAFCSLIATKGSALYKTLPENYKKALDELPAVNDKTVVMSMKASKDEPYYDISYRQFKILPSLVAKYGDIFKYSKNENVVMFEGFHMHDENGNHIPDPTNPNAVAAHTHNPDGTPVSTDGKEVEYHMHSSDQVPPQNAPDENADFVATVQFFSQDFVLQYRELLDNYFWIKEYFQKNLTVMKERNDQITDENINTDFFDQLNDLFIKEYIKQAKIDRNYKEPEKISEKELKAYFTKNINEFIIKEMYNLSWMIFDNESEAKKYFKRLEAGENFDKLIKEKYGVEDYLPSTFKSEAITKELKELLNSKKAGEYTSIIYVDGKYLIANILNKIEARPLNFEYVRDQIEEKARAAYEKDFQNMILAPLRDQIQFKMKNIEFMK